MKPTLILGGLFVAFILIMGISMNISYNNKYTSYENNFKAQVDQDKNIYDKVWKTIKQQANVSDTYAEKFKENYTAIMEGRNYGGEAMKWITESNPAFTPDLYEKLMNTIEVQRAEFATNQKKLISIHKEMADMKGMFPSSLFLTSRVLPDLKLVTSTRTEKVFTTGKDDDISLFENNNNTEK